MYKSDNAEIYHPNPTGCQLKSILPSRQFVQYKFTKPKVQRLELKIWLLKEKLKQLCDLPHFHLAFDWKKDQLLLTQAGW